MKIEITNEELYYQVDEVDLGLKQINGTFHGTVEISLTNAADLVVDGEHGAKDYEGEYGFIIVNEH